MSNQSEQPTAADAVHNVRFDHPQSESEDWADKIAAQQRHEYLAATVRIACNELCYLAERQESYDVAARIYAITEVLEQAMKEQEVSYAS